MLPTADCAVMAEHDPKPSHGNTLHPTLMRTAGACQWTCEALAALPTAPSAGRAPENRAACCDKAACSPAAGHHGTHQLPCATKSLLVRNHNPVVTAAANYKANTATGAHDTPQQDAEA